ncbi:hypothetical protein BT69DRAFT_563159 [Atractiella rhizophila]|nr:hypothetical protein BT69DRAFT_563159 [Atractiella rhizophila]
MLGSWESGSKAKRGLSHSSDARCGCPTVPCSSRCKAFNRGDFPPGIALAHQHPKRQSWADAQSIVVRFATRHPAIFLTMKHVPFRLTSPQNRQHRHMNGCSTSCPFPP